jgi:hypothetical protein
MKVGFIGLGNMGAAAARNVRRAGFDLYVYDIRREAGEALEAEGATWCDSPADMVSRVDVVMSMVFGPSQIEQVVRGPGGLLEGECSSRTWIDLTTSTPALMRELAREFEAAGGAAVDAPVTGSIDSCIRGDMIQFVGGADQTVARVQPVLDAVGITRRVGGYGNGYVAKLVNNQHYDSSFRLALCLKDLGLIDQFLDEVGTRSELTRAAHARFAEAADRYRDGAGEMTVCKVIEDDAGVELRVAGNWVAPWEVTHPGS